MTSMEIDNNDDAPVLDTPLIGTIEGVTMHPLVLLSVADHYHRVARGTRKRVVGVLLGSVSKGIVDCTNSFAVPFEEDSKNAVSFTLLYFVLLFVLFPALVIVDDFLKGNPSDYFVSSCCLPCKQLTFFFFSYVCNL